jgi:hypothetical protein
MNEVIDAPFRVGGVYRAPLVFHATPETTAQEFADALGRMFGSLADAAQHAVRVFSDAGWQAAERLHDLLGLAAPRAGSVVPSGVTIVRPARRRKPRRGGDPWLGWYAAEARWVPVRRVAGVGFVWSE